MKFYYISVNTQQLNGDVGPVSFYNILEQKKVPENCFIFISVISVEDVGQVQAEEEETR